MKGLAQITMLRIKTLISSLFNLGEKNVLGLDIGSISVKAIELVQAGGRYFIAGGGNVEISQNKSADRDERNAAAVDAICRCVKECGSNTDMAVCAVDAPDSAVRGFTLPAMPLEKVDYAVLQEAEHVSPAEMDRTVVDYQFVEDYQEGEPLRGMLAAARAEAVQNKCMLAESASLQAVVMDVESLALINCFYRFSMNQCGETAAIVHVNNSYASLIIANERSLPFIRNICYRDGEIVSSIANSLGIEEALVKAALFDNCRDDKTQEAVIDRFADSVKDLIRQISDTLRYYATHESEISVERIYLCGDIALVEGVEELFGSDLPQEVQVWNPVRNIGFASKVANRQMLEKNGPGMAVAIGLSMRAI